LRGLDAELVKQGCMSECYMGAGLRVQLIQQPFGQGICRPGTADCSKPGSASHFKQAVRAFQQQRRPVCPDDCREQLGSFRTHGDLIQLAANLLAQVGHLAKLQVALLLFSERLMW
jgi:hypothetical protein